MDMVVADGRAFRIAERIDATHVAQHALPDVMDVVEFNLVADADRRRVAPCPADGYACVEQIAYVVVRHDVVATVSNPHADGAVVDASATLDDAVVNGLLADGQFFRRHSHAPTDADFHTARAHVMYPALLQAVVITAVVEMDAVDANGADLALFEINARRIDEMDDGGNVHFRLPAAMAVRRQNVARMAERQSFESDIRNIHSHVFIAFDFNER